MVRIAESLDYNTPEPVLIVVGGSDWEVLAHVFPRHSAAIRASLNSSYTMRSVVLSTIQNRPTERRATVQRRFCLSSK